MLSGVLPFSGDTPFSIMDKHIYELPPAVVGYRTELSPAVDQVIQKALAKDRTRRSNTASDMVKDFKTPLPTDTPLPTNSNTPKPTATPIPTKSTTPTPTITPSPTLPAYHPPLDILAVTLTARAEGTPGAGATDTPFYNGDPLLPNNMMVVFWDSLYSNSNRW